MVRKGGPSRGCAVCRQRKTKCDLTTPECMKCMKSGRKCPGPIQDLFMRDMSSIIGGTVEESTSPGLEPKRGSIAHQRLKWTAPLTRVNQRQDQKVRHELLLLTDKNPPAQECLSHAAASTDSQDHGLIRPDHICIPSYATTDDHASENIARSGDFVDLPIKSARLQCTICQNTLTPYPDTYPDLCTPWTLISATDPDPFSMLPIKIDEKNQECYTHWLQFIVPESSKNYVYVEASQEQNINPFNEILPTLIMSDKVLFQATLAAAAGHKYAMMKALNAGLPSRNVQLAGLFYKTEVYRLMNERIELNQEAVSDTSIATVLCLAVDEWAYGNIKQYKIHRGGLVRMIELRNRLCALPPHLAFVVHYLDVLTSAVSTGFVTDYAAPGIQNIDDDVPLVEKVRRRAAARFQSERWQSENGSE